MKAEKRKFSDAILKCYADMPEELKNRAKELTVQDGHSFLSQGDVPEHLFLFLEGTARVFRATPKGNEYLMDMMVPGELAGEVEILNGDDCLCSVVAHGPCRAARFSRSLYREWIERDSDFSFLVIRQLCFRVRGLGMRAATHLSYPLEYSVLELLRERLQEGTYNLPDFSRSDLADYFGVSPRNMNRVLKKLQDKGLIQCDTGGIQLLSPTLLEELIQVYE